VAGGIRAHVKRFIAVLVVDGVAEHGRVFVDVEVRG